MIILPLENQNTMNSFTLTLIVPLNLSTAPFGNSLVTITTDLKVWKDAFFNAQTVYNDQLYL